MPIRTSRIALFTCAVLLLATLTQQAQARTDAAFMKQAAQNGAAEIEASKLAGTKAESADVKTYAATMVEDHSRVADELKTLAASKKVDLPSGPSIKQKAGIKLLGTAEGKAFDARYAKDYGVDAHEHTIKLFEEAARGASDADVKAWAQKTLPGLQHHLEMARTLAASPR